MTELTVRRFRPGDGARVRDLHETAMRAEGAYDEDVSDDDLADVAGTYLDGGEFLVGTADGRVVAMGAFRPVAGHLAEMLDADGAAEIKRMRVAPEHQRRGYGQRVYDELERRAREQGFDELVLDTMGILTGAQRLYETNGFERVRELRIEQFDEPFDLYVYRKSLG